MYKASGGRYRKKYLSRNKVKDLLSQMINYKIQILYFQSTNFKVVLQVSFFIHNPVRFMSFPKWGLATFRIFKMGQFYNIQALPVEKKRKKMFKGRKIFCHPHEATHECPLKMSAHSVQPFGRLYGTYIRMSCFIVQIYTIFISLVKFKF